MGVHKVVLPEFQKFLVSRKFVADRNIPFFALWVSRFIDFSSKNDEISADLLVPKYLDQLKNRDGIEDWQVRQAETAIKIYITYFLNKDGSTGDSENKVAFTHLPDALSKLRSAIRIKHYSYTTERTYIDWAKRFYAYLESIKKMDLSVEKLSPDDLRDYLSYLAITKQVSASTQNQAFNALLFLMRHVLSLDVSNLGSTVRAKRGQRLPVVLSRNEVKELFTYVDDRNLIIIQLLYGSGMRLNEVLRLRVNDIDFDSNMLCVRAGKGDKDRTTVLPEYVKSKLLSHLKGVKQLHDTDLKRSFGEVYLPNALAEKYKNAGREWKWQYVFPAGNLSVDPRSGATRRHHLGEKSIQTSVRSAVGKAKIVKHVTVHTLRHSFATHLLMDGVNIREIQELLGHKHVETTMIYTHVLRGMENAPKSPLDKLYGSKDKKNKDAVPLEVVGVTG